MTKAEGDTVVDVSLAIGRVLFTGHASGPSGALHRPRIIASATLAR